MAMAKNSGLDVKKVAELANLPLSSDEIEKYSSQLTQVVDYFKQLNEINTKSTEPTSQTTGLENVFRDDQVDETEVLSNEQALSGTEKIHNGYFVVPYLLTQKDK